MKKQVNDTVVNMTAEEIAKRQSEIAAWNDSAFDRAMADLRAKRNQLLIDTDFHGMSDNTMSAEMTTYRQELRDITEGITTVEQANAVVFPTKP